MIAYHFNHIVKCYGFGVGILFKYIWKKLFFQEKKYPNRSKMQLKF